MKAGTRQVIFIFDMMLGMKTMPQGRWKQFESLTTWSTIPTLDYLPPDFYIRNKFLAVQNNVNLGLCCLQLNLILKLLIFLELSCFQKSKIYDIGLDLRNGKNTRMAWNLN